MGIVRAGDGQSADHARGHHAKHRDDHNANPHATHHPFAIDREEVGLDARGSLAAALVAARRVNP